jgi:hypothetical protein
VKLDHTGIHASRCEHPSSALEKAFAEQWRNENKTFGVLDALMRAADTVDQNVFSPLGDSRPYQFADGVTQRDATVAASIIQWLGSNVGRCFLEEALKRAGYQLIRTGRSVRDDPRRLRCNKCGDTSVLFGPVGLGEEHAGCGGRYHMASV